MYTFRSLYLLSHHISLFHCCSFTCIWQVECEGKCTFQPYPQYLVYFICRIIMFIHTSSGMYFVFMLKCVLLQAEMVWSLIISFSLPPTHTHMCKITYLQTCIVKFILGITFNIVVSPLKWFWNLLYLT